MSLRSQLLFILCCFNLNSCVKKSNSLQSGKYDFMELPLKFSPKILGGNKINQGSPFETHSVGITDIQGQRVCTGVIVADKYILTAAHCVKGSVENLIITFGTDIFHEAFSVGVQRVHVSSNYIQRAERNREDIALVELAGRIPYSYSPVKIMPDSSSLAPETSLVVVGFGIYRFAKPMLSGILRSVVVRLSEPKYSDTEFYVRQGDYVGACLGDSGGPVYINLENKLYLVGITSRGASDCSHSIFTNTRFINMFISSIFN